MGVTVITTHSSFPNPQYLLTEILRPVPVARSFFLTRTMFSTPSSSFLMVNQTSFPTSIGYLVLMYTIRASPVLVGVLLIVTVS